MKKLLLLAAVLVLGGCSDAAAPLGPPRLLYGDVQGDGVIDMIDADLIQGIVTGSSVQPVALILACGDVDRDNKITILDSYFIRAFVLGIKNKAGRVGEPCLQ